MRHTYVVLAKWKSRLPNLHAPSVKGYQNQIPASPPNCSAKVADFKMISQMFPVLPVKTICTKRTRKPAKFVVLKSKKASLTIIRPTVFFQCKLSILKK